MADFTKLARWVLPGAVAITWLLGSLQLQRLLSLNEFSLTPVISSAVGLAIATVASVPFGFIIYQFYSHDFNNRLRLFEIVHKDVARQALTAAGLEADEKSGFRDKEIRGIRWRGRLLFAGQSWARTYWLWDISADDWFNPASAHERRSAMKKYYGQRERNWITVEWSLTQKKPQEGIDLSRAFAEVDRLSEVYHTLGAVKTAAFIATGLSAVVGLSLLPGHTANGLGFALGEFTTAALGVLVYGYLHGNRAHTLDRRTAIMEKLLLALKS
ncbi:hypothetical protein [Clavibacter zhangzhiyongii]|uniref:hypothetical protein n=1 Tax=Clavibacter zhangzhiyongii TaxID=2768071 RepID=UPI0039E0ED5F